MISPEPGSVGVRGDANAPTSWRAAEISRGSRGVPEPEPRALPDDLGDSEVQAPADAGAHELFDDVSADWAKQRPGEEIWVAREGRR